MQEYVVWQIEEEQIDWFVLEEGTYLSLSPDEAGCLASRAFPGLVLDVEALLAEDVSAVLARVQEQVGSSEHQGFVEHLRRQAGGE